MVPVVEGAAAAFADDGAVCLRQVFDGEWLELLADGVERNLAAPSVRGGWLDGDRHGFFQDSDNWTRIPELEAFVRHSPAAAIAGSVLGATKVNFLHDHVLVKEPGAAKPTLWHQDQPYSPVDGNQFLTMWTPLDPVGADAALRIVRGSHRAGVWYRPQRFVDGSLRDGDDERWEVLPDVDADPERWPQLSWPVEPGDCICFHGLSLHGAPGNVSSMRRRVVTTRWMGDDTRFVLRRGEMSPAPPPAGGPEPGAPLDSAAFPVIARRAEGGDGWVW